MLTTSQQAECENCHKPLFQVVDNEIFQPFYLPDMFCAAGEQIDAGGVNAAVAQHIRQPDNILEILIKYYGK